MFLLNSRQGHFSAILKGSGGSLLHPSGLPFSLSYGVILPSSLTRVLPIALVFSTYLPVSVCGTVTRGSLEAFLGSVGSVTCGLLASAVTPQALGAVFPTPFIALQVWHLNPLTG